jgi:hypothetical protein
MHALDWIKYLIGQATTIRRVAGSRASVWTGIALVLLTAVARNYDQTFITEKPFLWLFGPLLFSIVSGTWLYAIIYAAFGRRGIQSSDPRRSESRWPGFMGLFWMTAPIAWLYAIPVERFLDSVTAAKANVALLAIVSAWRVLLMARVMQVLVNAPFLMSLVWVLFAASIEVLVVFFFGGQFARAIMAGMGGMRNSPEEEILFHAMNAAFTMAFWAAPVTFIIALAWSARHALSPLPSAEPARMKWGSIAVATVLWSVIAIPAQRQVAHTVAVERLLAQAKPRAALDYLSAHAQDDFAPGRPLPPKPFERSVFEELPSCLAVVQLSDAPWVRAFLIRRLDEMCSHYDSPGLRRRSVAPKPLPAQLEDIKDGLERYGPQPDYLVWLLDGLDRIPEGKTWLDTNELFIEAIRQTANDPPKRTSLNEWLAVSNRIHNLVPATPTALSSNRPALPPAVR